MNHEWILIDGPQSEAAESPRAWESMIGGVSVGWHWDTLAGGRSDGVQTLRIYSGSTEYILLATRGLGLWQASRDGQRFGWHSPVAGPVHPQWVPLTEPNGLGWLDGFDELLVRCGLTSNGAPDFDAQGRLSHPLHGRIANAPAQRLEITVDDGGTITVRGEVLETRFLIQSLRLRSTLRLRPDSETLELTDEIINDSARPTTAQMLYHVNLGPPLLGPGAELLAPIRELAPRDQTAAAGLPQWSRCGGPQPGFAEQVYFVQLNCDERGTSRVLFREADGRLGCGLSFDHHALPYFVLWKNTAAEADGYVVGLEPSTNFPNPRTFESAEGRVIQLEPHGSVQLSLHLHLLVGGSAVDRFAQQVNSLGAGRTAPLLHERPRAGWSPS